MTIVLRLLLGALVVVWAGSLAIAADLDPAQVRSQFVDAERVLDRTLREVGSLKLTEAKIKALNAQTLTVKAEAEALRAAAQEQVEARRGLLESLGKPVEGQVEAADVAERRRGLETAVAEAVGWVHQGELVVTKADQALDRLSSKRIEALARTLAEVKPTPMDPRNWLRAASEVNQVLAITSLSIRVWIGRVIDEPDVRRAAIFVAALALTGLAVGWLLGRIGAPGLRRVGLDWGGERAPDAAPARVCAGAVEWLHRAMAWLVAGVLAYRALPDEDLLPNAIARALMGGAITGIAVFMAMRWAIQIALVPGRAGWRLPTIDEPAAQALARALTVLAGVVALDWAVVRAMGAFEDVDSFLALWALLACVALAWAIQRARRAPGWGSGHGWHLLRNFALVVAVLAVPLAAVGFSTLAQYVALGVIGTSLVLGAGTTARRLVREGLPQLLAPGSPLATRILNGLSIGAEAMRLAEFWLSLLLEFTILVGIVIGLLIVWGATVDDVAVFWSRLLEGVRIGSYTFSLADVMLASAVFMIAVTVTRYLQRVLDTRIFPRTTLDIGVRHSLRSGLGYVGLVLAATMAVSTLGLNISNLAFVAGALSVGIGFGLQNIVNNFVSGLILLVERPIKQGDWIVIGQNQGIVKRINVRATEIETFARSTVLIPNAEFLQTHLLNWTHRDSMARVDVTIQIPQFRGDAQGLRDMLLACVKARNDVLTFPAPIVLLKDLTPDHYVFDVFCFTADAFRRGFIASELRFAIDVALRAR